MADDLTFDFEQALEAPSAPTAASDQAATGPSGRTEPKPRNYRQVRITWTLSMWSVPLVLFLL